MSGRVATRADQDLYEEAPYVFVDAFQGPALSVEKLNAVYFFAYNAIREISVHSYSGTTPHASMYWLPRIFLQTVDSKLYCKKLGIDPKPLNQHSTWKGEMTVTPEELPAFMKWLGTWLSSANVQSPEMPYPIKGSNTWPMIVEEEHFHFYEWSEAAARMMDQISKWKPR